MRRRRHRCQPVRLGAAPEYARGELYLVAIDHADAVSTGALCTVESFVRDLHSAIYPELLNAEVVAEEPLNGVQEISFRRTVGTKG